MRLALELDAGSAAPGDAVSGRVRVLEGGPSRSLTLTVSFCERAPAFLSVVFSDGGVLHEGDLESGAAVEFRFDVPASAPPSVKGRHGELFWQLEAVSDQPGLDARVAARLEVVSRRAPRNGLN